MGFFVKNKKPVSAAEILDYLKEKFPNINKSTIYRQLDFLVEKQILTTIEVDSIKHYQLNANHPHIILICSRCKNFIIPQEKFSSSKISKIATNNNFQVNHYSLILFGLCSQCQEKKQ